MIPFDQISKRLNEVALDGDHAQSAAQMLQIGEDVLENWVEARGEDATMSEKEGFRLLALHRQGAKGTPGFNACRETCRELVYYYNLVSMEPDHEEVESRLSMMALVANHLLLFVSGKMQVEELGEFCCASKPIRNKSA